MYAIIETGGKQVKCEVGSTIFVEKLDVNAGDVVEFDKVVVAHFRQALSLCTQNALKSGQAVLLLLQL